MMAHQSYCRLPAARVWLEWHKGCREMEHSKAVCVCVCRWYMLQIDLHDKICLSLIVCVEEKANMLGKKLIKYSYGFGWRKTLYENCSTDETSTTNINWRIHISITGK
jgi:hypothetical protein